MQALNGREELNDWFQRRGCTKVWLADQIGVNRVTLWLWMIGEQVPNPLARQKIAEVTRGAVPVEAWE